LSYRRMWSKVGSGGSRVKAYRSLPLWPPPGGVLAVRVHRWRGIR